MQMDYIHDPKEYLEFMRKHKKVLVVSDKYDTFTIHDISLHKKGPREDKYYIKYPNMRLNVRRGNSLIETENAISFCRRGMVKFYDLEKKYLEQDNLGGFHRKVKDYIFDPVLDSYANMQVSLYRMFKENGEHCQFSYTQNRWIISSKNYTILVKDRDDLKNFGQERKHIWPIIIGNEWFNIIEKLEQSQITSLIELLQNHTLIGEYCGNQEYQHITRYDKIKIVFYAIVNNNSSDYCLPVQQSMDIIQQLGLEFVKTEIVNNVNKEEYNKILMKWLNDVGQASMDKEGEGSVVYTVSEKVINIFKIKTTEYHIYRRLREISKLWSEYLQKNPQDQYQQSKYLKRFHDEMLIMSTILPHKPLQYYLNIGQLCFQQIRTNLIPFNQIRYKFVDFLENLQKYVDQSQFKEIEVSNKQYIRILLITMPCILTDIQLGEIKQSLQLNKIEQKYDHRSKDQNQEQRALSILHILPMLPYNITDEVKLNEVLKENQDANLLFVFLGFNKIQLQHSIGNLKNQQFLKSNPLSQQISVQFTICKPNDLENKVNRYYQQCLQKLEEYQQKFPNRTFILDNLDIPRLEFIYNKFEQKIEIAENVDFDKDNIDDDIDIIIEKKIQIAVIYPIMIPGCGKSTINNYLKKNYKDYPYFDIHADEITLQHMNEKYKDDQDLSLAQKFQGIMKDIKQIFQQGLYNKVEQIIQSGNKKSILFIDRNCVPFTLQSTIEHFNVIKDQLQIKYGIYILRHDIALLPPEQIPNILECPFNIDFILTILHRLIERQDHILLGNDLMYKVKVCCKNVALFHQFKFKQSVFSKYNIKHFFYLDQFQDKVLLSPNDKEQFKKILFKCVETSIQSYALGEGDEYTELIKLYYQIKENYAFQQADLEKECKQNLLRFQQIIQQLM